MGATPGGRGSGGSAPWGGLGGVSPPAKFLVFFDVFCGKSLLMQRKKTTFARKKTEKKVNVKGKNDNWLNKNALPRII